MKKNILGLLSFAVAAIISFAFTTPTEKLVSCDGTSGKKWFVYSGPQFPDVTNPTLAQLRDPQNYTEATSIDDCTSVELLCAICAFEDGTTDRPVINNTVGTEIFSQLATYHASNGNTVPTPVRIVEKP